MVALEAAQPRAVGEVALTLGTLPAPGRRCSLAPTTPEKPARARCFWLASCVAFGLNVGMKFGIKITKSRICAVLASLTLSPGLSACGSSGPGSTPGNAHIKNENNYGVTSTLTIPVVPTAPGADLKVCWDKVTKDFMGHDVAPGGEFGIKAVHWGDITRLTEQQIQDKFSNGTFDSTKYLNLIRTFSLPDSSTTCAQLSQFKNGATQMKPADEYVVSQGDKYMLLFTSSPVQGELVRSSLFIQPTDGSAVTSVDGVNGDGELQFSADFNKPKVDIPKAGPFVIEWSQLTKDGVSVEVDQSRIDGLRLAFYPGYDVAKLANDALMYDRIPGATFYKAEIATGTSADLAATQTDSGQAFTGFTDASGLWIVALECSKCQFPAPVAVVILNLT
jgi:hypothetical protein